MPLIPLLGGRCLSSREVREGVWFPHSPIGASRGLVLEIDVGVTISDLCVGGGGLELRERRESSACGASGLPAEREWWARAAFGLGDTCDRVVARAPWVRGVWNSVVRGRARVSGLRTEALAGCARPEIMEIEVADVAGRVLDRGAEVRAGDAVTPCLRGKLERPRRGRHLGGGARVHRARPRTMRDHGLVRGRRGWREGHLDVAPGNQLPAATAMLGTTPTSADANKSGARPAVTLPARSRPPLPRPRARHRGLRCCASRARPPGARR